MVELIATVESISQAEALLEAGVDILYFGEDQFGLRLPHSFTRDEQKVLTELAHQYGKKVSIAVNAIFHNEGIQAVPEYLTFLKSIGVDTITLGDPGVVNLMKDPAISIPYRYDAQVLVTSSRSINFWAKRGAVGAVVAREVPRDELKILAKETVVPVEFLVYGATCIHQSKRPLLQNYYNFIEKQEEVTRDRGLFLSEPRKPESHYSIYQDVNGTHIFANNDVLLAKHLQELTDMGVAQWKLEGIFSPGDNFVKIVQLFAQARDLIEAGKWSDEQGEALEAQIRHLHPTNRGVDTGFFLYEPNFVK
ncbi:U32 family peptidase [Tuanshanicoccus lijuaniae]|uniref:peptidase U32 family protein n=1 Tax=Aerococcaceae bacterium zg-1292 TaxID=2774330 RepID=UPI0019377396|nr:U32 family peptidase [Aerococcaceae bacterium zg-1292]QQA36686.1 U32 family peptidase [Aerococcaceae bacterium zg-1292]